jgi:Replication initiation factor
MVVTNGLVVQPPLTNRGVKPSVGIEVGLDWFQGTVVSTGLLSVVERLEFWLDGKSKCDRAVGFRGLSYAIAWNCGAYVSWGEEQPWLYVRLPGAVVDAIGQLDYQCLVTDLLRVGVKPTRIDLYRDDFRKLLHPSVLKGWADDGLLRRKKVYGYHESNNGTYKGSTFTAGTRGGNGSGCFVRYYDKSQHARDISDCYRLECEFSSGQAEGVGALLLAVNGTGREDYLQLVDSLVVDQIEFRDKPRDVRRDRCQLLEEWAEYLADSNPIRVSKLRSAPKLVRSLDALCRQYGGLLANLSTRGADVLFGVVKLAVQDATKRGMESSISEGKGRRTTTVSLSRDSGEWEGVIDFLNSISKGSSFRPITALGGA